ncbi:MAG TPA: SEC-C metal-binding domain-containing protein, partial [Solirubrobacteraceae bacterium]|nr:SEC-C metal-binding domain-containing protein [Solirubrobacteraceae bacterium]
RVLNGADMREDANREIADVVGRMVELYTPGDYIEDWDLGGLFVQIADVFPTSLTAAGLDPDQLDRAELKRMLVEDATERYDQREAQFGHELMRELERYLLLQIIDERWREHLYDMDYLREGIHLRGFAQIDPLVAYKNEAFDLFTDMMNGVWADFARMIYNVDVEIDSANGAAPDRYAAPSSSSTRPASVSYSGGGQDQPSALAQAAAAGGPVAAGGAEYLDEGQLLPHVEQRRVDENEQVGRNDPCWCGSGKKFKRCHGA